LKALRTDQGCKLPLLYLCDSEETSESGLKAMCEFADGVAPNKRAVLDRPELVKDAHDLGMSVTVWTFRQPPNGKFATLEDEMRYFLRDLKVDALFTDNPDQFPRE
jgi:glycerophosphoryl diester phosphodiesterase